MRRHSLLTLAVLIGAVSAGNDFNFDLENADSLYEAYDSMSFARIASVYDSLRNCSLDFTSYTEMDPECAKQMDISCRNNLLFSMLDASAKFPYTSVLTATKQDYGNYDQCVRIDSTIEEERIRGRYCLVGLIIPDPSVNGTDEEKIAGAFKLGTCTPDKCTANDMNAVLAHVTRGVVNVSLFQDGYCKVRQDTVEYTRTDIVTIAIISACVAMMTLCTMYDVYLYQTGKKTAHPLLLSFSVFSNGKKLLQTSAGNREQIQIFHGLKTISMMWILAAHGSNGWHQIAVYNLEDADTYTKDFYTFYLYSAYMGVDTFFYISGFLMSYQYLKQRTKPLIVQVLTLPQSILHRYLRLTPAVLILYLVSISVFAHLGTGPIYEYGNSEMVKPCKDHWWSFFLYIQNYVNKDEICLIHTWYLSSDMQMFLMGIVLMIPVSLLLKNKKNFKMVMICLLIFNGILTAIPIAVRLNFRDYVNEYDAHSRLMLYFIGVMMGAFMRLKKDEAFLYNKFKPFTLSLLNLLIWIVMLTGMFLIVIFQRKVYHFNYQDEVTWFDCLKRPVWAMGLSWMVYSSYHGYAGFINWFLSSPIMQVGGRLSYCMYLVHGLVIVYHIFTIRTRHFFSDYNMFALFCVYLIWTIIWSFFWTLAFESPLIVIERFLLGGGGRAAKKPPPPPAEKSELPPHAPPEPLPEAIEQYKITAEP